MHYKIQQKKILLVNFSVYFKRIQSNCHNMCMGIPKFLQNQPVSSLCEFLVSEVLLQEVLDQNVPSIPVIIIKISLNLLELLINFPL